MTGRGVCLVANAGSSARRAIDTPFIRYHVIDMAAKLDIDLGVPVAGPVPGDNRVSRGMLPAGRYAMLVYQDVGRGVEANRRCWSGERGGV